MNPIPENSILLQDHLHGALDWILFTDPMCIVQANAADEVESCLKAIEEYLNKGYYAAGYLAYEASRGLDSSLCTDNAGCDYPVLWFGIYGNYRTFDITSIEDTSFHLNQWEPDITGDDYNRAIEKIRNYIRRGETYQVNFTFRLRNSFSGNPLSLAKALFEAQASDYCAYINLGRHQIISASPELFFKHASRHVLSKPMKGTVKRGLFDSDDDQRISWLKNSEKNRAENVMIVDMIRNDMGRIADVGSVRVDELFSIERYPTVFQMTSTVSSTTRNSSVDILRKMFPCASVTGAPKVRTMQIIREVESGPRGIYTGSIGYFRPDDQAQFNVAIRTVVIDSTSSTAEYGVGGGIVWDSRASDEFNECRTKAEILTHREPVFQLLESLLWTPARDFLLLDRHLERMARAARYFNFSYDRRELIATLRRAVEARDTAVKVRLVLDKSGGAEAFVEPLSSAVGKTVYLALSGVDTQSAFTYHKTTTRALYTDVLVRYPDASDVILVNREGLVTESCTANVVIKTGDGFITPALRNGLLGGVYREQLLDEGRIAEGRVTPEDLLSAEAIYLINSVRGWMTLSPIEINPVAKQGKWKILEEHLFDPDKLFFRKSNSGP